MMNLRLITHPSFYPIRGKKMIEKANQRVSRGLPFSTYDLYKDDVGVFPSKAHQTDESIPASNTIGEILNIPETSAVFFIKSEVINRKLILKLYHVPDEKIVGFYEYAPGLAIKATIERPLVSADIGDKDIYGCQQYGPLMNIEIPWD
jgi:hypothetical protein